MVDQARNFFYSIGLDIKGITHTPTSLIRQPRLDNRFATTSTVVRMTGGKSSGWKGRKAVDGREEGDGGLLRDTLSFFM